MKKIYLDHAAATPMDNMVLKAMEPYFSEQFYNPSALYLDAKNVSNALNDARKRIAGWLGARPGEIVFTAGGTEANNLAIHGIMRAHPNANLVISSVEHEAVMRPAAQYDCRHTKVDKNGVVNPIDLKKLIDEKTVLVSVMYANNEVGTIEPLADISRVIEEVRQERQANSNSLPIYFHTDACQAAGYLDLHVSRTGVDLMTINSGKIYGPKQCGALYIRAGTQLQPQILGGGQELGVRSGTENAASVIGFAKALDEVQYTRHEEIKRLIGLQKSFINLLESLVPSLTVNGPLKQRLPNNVHVTIAGQDNERLVMALDEAGIQCAAGSACAASSDEPSHVLKAIGLTDKEARSSLRFTMGKSTTEKDIEQTVKILAKLVA